MSRFCWDLGAILRTEAHRRVLLFAYDYGGFLVYLLASTRQVSLNLCDLLPLPCMKRLERDCAGVRIVLLPTYLPTYGCALLRPNSYRCQSTIGMPKLASTRAFWTFTTVDL
jgi:hypothetical protein